MLSSNATTDTIAFFVNWVKEASPDVRPKIIMMDRDQAQIKALGIVYLESRILLCIWHVLCAFQAHFVTEMFESLWDKVKKWVKTDDLAKFKAIWNEISTNPKVSKSFVEYLKTNWMSNSDMWTVSTRTE